MPGGQGPLSCPSPEPWHQPSDAGPPAPQAAQQAPTLATQPGHRYIKYETKTKYAFSIKAQLSCLPGQVLMNARPRTEGRAGGQASWGQRPSMSPKARQGRRQDDEGACAGLVHCWGGRGTSETTGPGCWEAEAPPPEEKEGPGKAEGTGAHTLAAGSPRRQCLRWGGSGQGPLAVLLGVRAQALWLAGEVLGGAGLPQLRAPPRALPEPHQHVSPGLPTGLHSGNQP